MFNVQHFLLPLQPQIKNKLHFMNYKILTATLLCCLFTTITNAQEPYWIQTFEDTIPASKDTFFIVVFISYLLRY